MTLKPLRGPLGGFGFYTSGSDHPDLAPDGQERQQVASVRHRKPAAGSSAATWRSESSQPCAAWAALTAASLS
jgi:hypothetical protein